MEETEMKNRVSKYHRGLACLLCLALLLTNIPLFVSAENTAERPESATTAVTAVDVQTEEPRQFSWTVHNVNYNEKGDVIVLNGFWAVTIKDTVQQTGHQRMITR
jgi:hypothetical protein